MNLMLKKSLPHLAAVLLFLGLAAVYFLPQLEGKVIRQGDLLQYRGMTQEILEFEKKTGEKPLWTDAMFGGMPTYQINTPGKGNYLSVLDGALRLGINHPIGRFLAAMLSFYILMLVLGANQWLAVIGAVAFGFTTNSFTLYEAGHITKLRAISYFPLVAAGMIVAYRGRYLWGGLLFAAGLGLNILANHVQMSYYLALTIPFFVVAELVRDIRRGELPHFAKASAVLLLAGVFAIGSSTANLWMTYEYSKDTMRGTPILEKEAAAPQTGIASSSETEGLSWDYAMQWSNGWVDLFASFIPGAAGGGSGEKLGPGSAIYQDLTSKGASLPAEFQAPLYWGALPFTSGPIYFGAVVVMLFLLGLVLVKEPVKWWIGLGALLTLLLSMGKNLPAISEFFYHYVPLYSKFRTPNSILSVTSFLLPVLGVLALDRIVRGEVSRSEALRALYFAGGVSGGIALVMWLLGPSLFTFTSPGDAQYQQAGWDINAMIADRQRLLRSDALRSFVLVALAGGLLWAFLQDKLKKSYLFLGLGLLTLGDLWLVDRRYLDYDSFVDKRSNDSYFQPRAVDEQILQDTDPNFRVLDLTVNTFNSAQYSYFHKMIGGYHAAKLQRYQDIIDRHIVRGNQAVLDMLNTRYFITKGPEGQPVVQANPNALGNAWFVDTIRLVDTPNEEINALNDINPGNAAVVHREFAGYVNGLTPTKTGSIELTDYRPDHLTYQANAGGETLAVFSEIWYGPNKGWQAFIDGQPADFIRVNYALRGLRLPAGQHKVEFVFRPRSFFTGRVISSAFSILTLLGLLGFAGYNGYQLLQKGAEEPAPEPTQPAAKASARPKPRRKRK